MGRGGDAPRPKKGFDREWAVKRIAQVLTDYGIAFEREHEFLAPVRHWALDFAILPLDLRVGIEYEGGQHMTLKDKAGRGIGSRHRTPMGYEDDLYKYNAAKLAGWRVFQLTTNHVKGDALYVHDLVQAIAASISDFGVPPYHRVFTYRASKNSKSAKMPSLPLAGEWTREGGYKR